MCTQFLLTMTDLLGARRVTEFVPPSEQGEISEQDRIYVSYAYRNSVFEFIIGNLAAAKGTCPGVRELGAEFVQHHVALGANLIAIATRNGLQLSDVLDPDQAGQVVRLSTLTGPEFDSSWLREQVDAHLRVLTLGVLELAYGRSADVKQLVLDAEPVLNSRLDDVIAVLTQCASRDTRPSSREN